MKAAAILAMLAFAGTASAASTPNFTPFAGGAPAYKEQSAMMLGNRVTIVRITSYFHQMDLPPHSAQPIGLEYFMYFLKDTAGNMAHCEKWIDKVQADEAAWTKQKPTFPYLEINTAKGAKPFELQGHIVYHGKDIRCWEAMDFGPPLY